MPRTLNIYTGYQCEFLSSGTDVVIFQGEDQEYSALYGKQLTFIEYFPRSNRVKLAFKRGMQTASTGGVVVHPVFVPNCFDGQLSDSEHMRYVQLSLMPRSSVTERFASEAITNARIDETTTEMFIEIDAHDFTLAVAREFHQIFQSNYNGLPYISAGDTLICNAPVALSHSNGMHVWTNAAELTVTDTYKSGKNGVEGYYCTNARTQDWSFNNGVLALGKGVVTMMPIEDSTQADYKVYKLQRNDEIFIELGQLMWLPIATRTSHPTPMPSKFMFQGVPIPAWFSITYHTRDGQSVKILEDASSRSLRESRESLERSMQMYSENSPDTLAQVSAYAYSARLNPTTIASLGPISMSRSSGQQDWQVIYQGLQESNTPTPPPTQPKYATGTVVMATVEGKSSIPARHKNKEWKVHGYIGYSSSRKEHQYKIQSHVKKNINKGVEMIVMESELVPVEKILKRKFELARKIGKYQQGQVFTKEELVNTFAKFQDAQDPFILNKIYVCAESPSEK